MHNDSPHELVEREAPILVQTSRQVVETLEGTGRPLSPEGGRHKGHFCTSVIIRYWFKKGTWRWSPPPAGPTLAAPE
jgi:hypothetical protein